MDQPDQHDPLDPQSDQVRRLLAEARHDEPVPGDVATRLDRVLATLVAEEPVLAPAADLAAHRRRRARTVLVAAAAAVAVGVGIGQLDLTSTSGDADSSADGSAGGGAASDEAAGSSAPAAAAEAAPQADGAARPAPRPTSATPVEVTSQGFARDARRRARVAGLLGGRPTLASNLDSSGEFSAGGDAGSAPEPAVPEDAADADSQLSNDALRDGAWFTCEPGPYGEGRLTAVEYDDQSAVLAFRPPTKQTVVVELLQCGTGTVLRSMTIPLP
ncbi:hypothetical protein [Nocardioides dongkuii]|uniref:hypothetical protein n=1 Tax=Nocardioides dongkuii TaxID=2760089 RepID=UPI0015FDD2B8|nr:hypothetical protein [Nocardioides dongkuii]